MVPARSWVNAPKEAIILGLKELPHCADPISQRHIFFAHAYKVNVLTIRSLLLHCKALIIISVNNLKQISIVPVLVIR